MQQQEEWLIGKWKSFDSDSSMVLVISMNDTNFSIKCFDEDDGEQFDVSNIEWDRSVLKFHLFVPSVNRTTKYIIHPVSEYLFTSNITYKEKLNRKIPKNEIIFSTIPNISSSELAFSDLNSIGRMVGRWIPSGDYTWGPVVEIKECDGGLRISEFAIPEQRNEVYLVSNISWEGNCLTFDSGVPHNWKRRHKMEFFDNNLGIDEITIFHDPWKKIESTGQP